MEILDSFGDIEGGKIEIGRNYLGAAHCCLKLKKYTESKEHFAKAEEFLKNNEIELAKYNIIYAKYLMRTGLFENSKKFLDETLETFIKNGNKEGTGKTYYYLGELLSIQGKIKNDIHLYDQAIEYYKQAQECVKDTKNIVNLGEPNLYSLVCVGFGNVSMEKSDLIGDSNIKEREEVLKNAEIILKEAEQLMRSFYTVSNPWVLGKCLFSIAELYKRQRNYKEAAIYYQDCALMKERDFDTDQKEEVADAIRLSGVMEMYSGNIKNAESLLKRAKEIFKNIGGHLDLANCLYNISYIENRKGEYQNGLSTLELAERYCPIDNNELLSLIYSNQVLLMNKLARYEEGIELYHKRMKMINNIPTSNELYLLMNVSVSYYKLAKFDKTKELLNIAKGIMEKGDPKKNIWNLYYVYNGRLNNRLSHYNDAMKDLKKAIEIYQNIHSKYAYYRESATECLITLSKVHFNLSTISDHDYHLKEASKYIHQVLKIRQSLFAHHTNEIAEINDFIGFLYFKLHKRINDAHERVQIGLKIRKERSLAEGYDHPDVIEIF